MRKGDDLVEALRRFAEALEEQDHHKPAPYKPTFRDRCITVGVLTAILVLFWMAIYL